MPWIVGIDEAGYGPNLGPLVQAAVGLRLPIEDPAGWKTYKTSIRRSHERDDGRLLIDDSKKVYTGPHGLTRLETSVLNTLQRPQTTLAEFSSRFCLPQCHTELCAEPWYQADDLLKAKCPKTVEIDFVVRINLVQPTRFNRVVALTNSKGSVLSEGLITLLQSMFAETQYGEAIHFLCDKQGGRNFYAPVLQEAFPDGWVIAERESATESRYRIAGFDREISVDFRPRADAESVCTAFASMVCKYLREVCMKQFNAFWQKHLPELKPTAGYPLDAKRYYAEIQPMMTTLNISADSVWRKK